MVETPPIPGNGHRRIERQYHHVLEKGLTTFWSVWDAGSKEEGEYTMESQPGKGIKGVKSMQRKLMMAFCPTHLCLIFGKNTLVENKV